MCKSICILQIYTRAISMPYSSINIINFNLKKSVYGVLTLCSKCTKRNKSACEEIYVNSRESEFVPEHHLFREFAIAGERRSQVFIRAMLNAGRASRSEELLRCERTYLERLVSLYCCMLLCWCFISYVFEIVFGCLRYRFS